MASNNPTPAGAEPQGGNDTNVTDDRSAQLGGSDTPPSAFDAASAIDAMDDVGEMEKILFGGADPSPAKPAAPTKTEEPAPSGQQDPSPAPSSEQQDTDDDETAAPAAREPDQNGPDRISLRSLPPAERKLFADAVALFRNGDVATLEDAITKLAPAGKRTPQEPDTTTQQPATAQQDAQSTAPQTDAPQPDAEVARLSSVLADLRSQRRQAIADYDRQTESELTDQIEDALTELSEAKATARITRQQQARQQALVQSAIEEVHLQFPESEDPASFFSFRLGREIDAYEATHGPIGENPRKLMDIARKVAADVGQTTSPPVARQAPKPEPQARPLGVAAPGQNPAPRLTGEALYRKIDEASEEELFAALTGS